MHAPPPPAASSVRVETFAELQEALFADAWNGDLRRFRSRLAFRGLSDATYPLDTTLARLGGPYVELERHLLRNFRKYAHRDVVERDSLWHWLTVAQHHGLPTRLLDWTYSPLVAMHFATASLDRFDCDGAIVAVNYVRAHELLPEELRLKLEQEGANVFTVEMLAEEVRSLEQLEHLSPDDFAIFFEPPSLDDRIVNQFALFSTMSSADSRLDAWLALHPALHRRVILPAALKWEVRDKLDQSNVTERVLFPGVDGLSAWLRRHYSPRG